MTQQSWGQSSQGWGQQRPSSQQRPLGQPWGQQQWGQQPWGQPSSGSQQPRGQQPWGQQPWGQQSGRNPNQPFGQSAPAPGGWGPPAGRPQPRPRGGSGMGKVLLTGIGLVCALVLVMVVVNSLRPSQAQENQVAYQNEDYKVPPPDATPPALPQPKTEAEAEQLLVANKLYATSVPTPTRCELEALDLGAASSTQIKRHMDDLTACMMRVWEGPLSEAGYTMVRPVSNVYGSKVNTPCGNNIPGGNAFYCGANQQVYYSTSLPEVLPPQVASGRFVVESVIAHEIGHAIQARTGILISTRYFQSITDDKAAIKLLNRRVEVQADCFMGEFLGSVMTSTRMTQADLDNIEALSRAIGDDTLSGKPDIDGDHGLGRSRAYWTQMGMASTKVGACNTFVASPSTVR